MNKYISKFFLSGLGIILVSLISCKKNNYVVDQDVTAPAYAKFNVIKSPVYTTDSSATYFVKNSGEKFKLPVGITNVSNKDRTIQFTYTSNTASQGVQYNAPTSITIAAGKALDTLEISGIYDGIDIGQVDTVRVQIIGTDEVAMSPYKNHFFIYMRKQCEIILPDLEGNYNNTFDNASYGPYTTVVTPGSGTLLTPTSGTFTIENIWDPGVPVITTVNVDWTADPDHPILTIPDQEYFAPADVWIKGTVSVGSFSSCDQTFILKYDLYYKTDGSEFAFDQETILRR